MAGIDTKTLAVAQQYAEQLALGGAGLQEKVESSVNQYLAKDNCPAVTKDYVLSVSAEQIGLAGDGITNDTEKCLSAFKTGKNIIFDSSKQYKIKLQTIYENGYIEKIHDVSIINCDYNLTFDSEVVFNNVRFINNIDSKIVIMSTSRIIFNGCAFDNMSLQINTNDTYKGYSVFYRDCKFITGNYSPVYIAGDSISVTLDKCTFDDFSKIDAETYNANENSCRFWKWNPIDVYASNVSLIIDNCTFENLIPTHVLYVAPNYENIYVEFINNTVKNTMQNGIAFESVWSGKVVNNQFYDIGMLESETYQHKDTGVGCNAIYTSCEDGFCDVVISNNIIDTVVENAIEGCYNVITNNVIRNTGANTNYVTPSIEGIYTYSKVIANNVLQNLKVSSQGKAYIELYPSDLTFPCIIEGNKIIGNDDNYGIQITQHASIDHKIILRNNTYDGIKIAVKNVSSYNRMNDGIIFCDYPTEAYPLVASHLLINGIEICSPVSKSIDIKNSLFIDTDESGIITDWIYGNGTVTRECDDDGAYLELIGKDEYGKIRQLITLPPKPTLCCIKITYKSDKTIKVFCASLKQSDKSTVCATEILPHGTISYSFTKELPATDGEYITKYITFYGKQVLRLTVTVSEAAQVIDFKEISGVFI